MIISFKSEQRAFCLNTSFFAKHPFTILALKSSPTEDLISGEINTTMVVPLLLR